MHLVRVGLLVMCGTAGAVVHLVHVGTSGTAGAEVHLVRVALLMLWCP